MLTRAIFNSVRRPFLWTCTEVFCNPTWPIKVDSSEHWVFTQMAVMEVSRKRNGTMSSKTQKYTRSYVFCKLLLWIRQDSRFLHKHQDAHTSALSYSLGCRQLKGKIRNRMWSDYLKVVTKNKCYTLPKESRTPRSIYQGDLELTLAAGWPSVLRRAWACVRSWTGAVVGTWLLACGWKGNKTGIRQNCRIRLESICFVSWLYVSIFFSNYLLVVKKIATAVLYVADGVGVHTGWLKLGLG